MLCVFHLANCAPKDPGKGNAFLTPNCVWFVILGPAKRHHCTPPFSTADHKCSPSSLSPFFLLMTAHCTFPPGSRVHPQLLLDYPCAGLISPVICVHDHPIAHHACLSLFARGIPVQDIIWVSSSCCDPGLSACSRGKEGTYVVVVPAWSGRAHSQLLFLPFPLTTPPPPPQRMEHPQSLQLGPFLCWFSPCSASSQIMA